MDWRREQSSFEGLAGFYEGTVNLADEGYPERHSGAFVSADMFDLVRARPSRSKPCGTSRHTVRWPLGSEVDRWCAGRYDSAT